MSLWTLLLLVLLEALLVQALTYPIWGHQRTFLLRRVISGLSGDRAFLTSVAQVVFRRLVLVLVLLGRTKPHDCGW